ncbi:hypothetical protein [Nocardia sp. NPDC047038]|uniref:hypothetical protein n=1 Tax=Nocardia sp. NPDC047038 TaxID=3154338 RepID=UPI0033CA1A35
MRATPSVAALLERPVGGRAATETIMAATRERLRDIDQQVLNGRGGAALDRRWRRALLTRSTRSE